MWLAWIQAAESIARLLIAIALLNAACATMRGHGPGVRVDPAASVVTVRTTKCRA
jgi:predicted small secreted protein